MVLAENQSLPEVLEFLMGHTVAKKRKASKTGPQAERVKIAGDWKGAIGKALTKPLPAGGWPKPAKKKPV